MREFSQPIALVNTPTRGITPQPSAAQPGGCLGVMCERHARCTRYAAVEGMPGSDGAIGTCVRSDGSRPLFQEVAP